jgi:hypothetical protein
MQYSVSVNNIQGYETVQQNHCQGQIKDKEIKTCLTTIYDSTKPLSIPSSQPIGGADQSTTAQPPSSSQSIGGADQSATAQPPSSYNPLEEQTNRQQHNHQHHYRPHKLKEEELRVVQEEVQATFFLALHSTLQQMVTLEIILTLMKTWQQTIQRLF